ncbi:MAG: FAD-dependent oxidoreductase, partial [Burkholderiales bacterium]
MKNTRRNFLKVASASAGLSAVTGTVGCASVGGVAKPKVVVVGGGYGGATVAKYIKMWEPSIDVTVVERNPNFVSCPISNLVLGGSQKIEDITMSYAALQSKYGVKVLRGEAVAIDV